MYQLMLNRKNSKKGFTLVEVIVVLVILAILAAIMIPAMTGWIDKANEKAILVEARTALIAAQTIASESYGLNGTAEASRASVASLSGLSVGCIGEPSLSGSQVTGITYTKGGQTATYSAGKWTVN